MRHIYQARCTYDQLYAVLTTSNLATIDPHIAGIMELLKARNRVSPAVLKVLQRTLDGKNVTAKHAVILFALHAEPALQTWFAQNSNERVVAEYTANVLPSLVHAMTTGHYETLTEFVGDARSEFVCI